MNSVRVRRESMQLIKTLNQLLYLRAEYCELHECRINIMLKTNMLSILAIYLLQRLLFVTGNDAKYQFNSFVFIIDARERIRMSVHVYVRTSPIQTTISVRTLPNINMFTWFSFEFSRVHCSFSSISNPSL